MGPGDATPDGRGDDELRQTIAELARRVAELETRRGEDPAAPRSLGFSDAKLATIATSMYRSREFRGRYFDAGLFADPAWDMLLDLFINAARGRRISTISLCIAAHLPQATGLRWIERLAQQGLVRRLRAPDDARIKLIELTADGYSLMRRYLSDSTTRFEMPVLAAMEPVSGPGRSGPGQPPGIVPPSYRSGERTSMKMDVAAAREGAADVAARDRPLEVDSGSAEAEWDLAYLQHLARNGERGWLATLKLLASNLAFCAMILVALLAYPLLKKRYKGSLTPRPDLDRGPEPVASAPESVTAE